MEVSKSPVERRDSGIDILTAHGDVLFTDFTRLPVAQKMIQECLHGEEDLAEHHRAKRCLGTQCARARRTPSSSMKDGAVFPLFEELNTDYARNSNDLIGRCSGTHKLNAPGDVHVHGSTRTSRRRRYKSFSLERNPTRRSR